MDGYGDRADVFLSHSHRDYQAVMNLAVSLLDSDIVPWLAETHIQQGDHIHDRIIDALDSIDVFLLFLTPNALDSRWTGKEYGAALRNGIPIFVVGNIDFTETEHILRLLHCNSQVDSLLNNVQGDVRHFLHDLIEDKGHIVQTFWYSGKSSSPSMTFPTGILPHSKLPLAVRTHQAKTVRRMR